MKKICVVWLTFQIITFTVLSFFLYGAFRQIIAAGGGLDERFFSTQLARLIAFHAPYLILPFTIFITYLLYKQTKYKSALILPLTLIVLIFGIGQIYLKSVPDPIKENFAARSEPYPGFLVLPNSAIPGGFEEKEHYYSKRQYTISYTKMIDNKKIDLDVVEGDNIHFDNKDSTLIKKFEFKGIAGQVYSHTHKKTGVMSFNLIWLNPPKQRISIYLTQTPKKDYSAEDLIKILKLMEDTSANIPEYKKKLIY